MESSLVLSGALVNFTYRVLQIRTSNFSQLLRIGGFGSVYKGSLGDGTSVCIFAPTLHCYYRHFWWILLPLLLFLSQSGSC
ncbi:unnamed protein product [Lathyrus sativus]|nr:unnamed protein product [Lathyrus sativus]